jgi:hypothetical protein
LGHQITKKYEVSGSFFNQWELTAVLRVLMAVTVKIRMYKFTGLQITRMSSVIGSKKPLLDAVALNFSPSVQYQIRTEPDSKDLTKRANYLSRIIDYDDWELNTLVLAELDDAWNPFCKFGQLSVAMIRQV